MINYTQELREHNLKVTPQRLAITDALYMRGHMSVDNLYELMLKNFSSISLATIYKNINIMLHNSFIQEVKIPHAKSVYELTKATHSHLVCEKCGEVEDITLNTKKIMDELSSKSTFQGSKIDLVISGICKKCQ